MASDILINIGSSNGLMPFRRQAITWTMVTYPELNSRYIRFLCNIIKDSKDYMQQNTLEKVGKLLGWLQWAQLILGLRPANDRRRYKVTPSLIGQAQT